MYKYINETEFKIIEKLIRNGLTMDEAERTVYPLSWYISTGRCPTESYMKIIHATSRQLTTIAKRLMIPGSHNDSISRIMEYVSKI